MNPNAPARELISRRFETSPPRAQFVRMLLTAACGVGLSLLMWVLIVMLLDHRFHGYENIVWSGSLWISAMTCTGIVANSRRSVRPVLSCTVAFAVFGLAYMLFEGPIFGDVSKGGDPSVTEFVVLNLACLPLGVFAAAEAGRWLGHRRRNTSAEEQTAERANWKWLDDERAGIPLE